jgi:hypothetical protein
MAAAEVLVEALVLKIQQAVLLVRHLPVTRTKFHRR